MISFVGRYEVWVFFCVVILVNAVFVWGIASDLLPQGWYGYGRFFLLGGTLAAVVMMSRGIGGVFALVRPLTKWQVHPRWYLFGLFWAVATCVAVLLILIPFGGGGLSAETIGLGPLGKFGVVRMLVFGSLVGEVVWIGYALNRLAPKYGYFIASQIVGVIWTL